jgi:hypothetical protein
MTLSSNIDLDDYMEKPTSYPDLQTSIKENTITNKLWAFLISSGYHPNLLISNPTLTHALHSSLNIPIMQRSLWNITIIPWLDTPESPKLLISSNRISLGTL